MSIYKNYSADEIDHLFSQFLMNKWSYSKVTQFARNEKAFEMLYIYNEKSKQSATTIAGQAYHHALEKYFTAKQVIKPEHVEDKTVKTLSLPELERFAYDYLDDVPGNSWKLQKTTPTVSACITKATDIVTKLLKNFYKEREIYEDDIEEILFVEVITEEFITVNGVDIPLPCSARLDLGIRTKSGKNVIVDHKSKEKYTDVEVLKLTGGIQAITYVNSFESLTGHKVDEVWYMENKHVENKDKSPQIIRFAIEIDDDTRRLYEALLYEPLKRMLEAINNPDYIYLINDSDNMVDKAELYDFWAKTQIAEIGDFDIDPDKVELVEKRLKKIKDSSIAVKSPTVIRNYRKNAAQFIKYDLSTTDMNTKQKIEHVLRGFNAIVTVEHEFSGYSSNTYLLDVSAGVTISSIKKYGLDLANALNVSNVRFSENLVLHQGKSFLSIDFSKKRERNLIFDLKDLKDLKIPFGRNNFEDVIVWDLNNPSTPHVLVGGATGGGKSNMILCTVDFLLAAGVDDIIIFDPKYEFLDFAAKGIRVVNEMDEIELEMAILVEEMNLRKTNGNKKLKVVIIDEFADIFDQTKKTKQLGKTVEGNLKILTQTGRSLGFRVLAATQRPSTKVITGDAKVNFPVQICFRVNKVVDSKVVLDEAGAECLAGHGDGLLKSPEYHETVRFQAYFKP